MESNNLNKKIGTVMYVLILLVTFINICYNGYVLYLNPSSIHIVILGLAILAFLVAVVFYKKAL